MDSPDHADELKAVEIAADIVEHLRQQGSYTARYGTELERATYQRAGRIARTTVKPRRMTARSFGGVFAAWWTEPTPLEQEMNRHKAREAMNAIAQPLGELQRRERHRRQERGEDQSGA